MPDLVVSSIGTVADATADTTVDLVTLEEAKPGLNIAATDTSDDAELALIITAVSQRFRELCGPIINTTYTDEVYDGGDGSIVLRNAGYHRSVTTTVSAVKEYDSTGALTTLSAESATSKPADAWVVGSERNVVWRRGSGGYGRFTSGVGNILVTYVSGRAADTAAVPARFKQAAIITINHIFSSLGANNLAARQAIDGSTSFGIPSFSIPKAALDLIRDELVAPIGVG